MKTFKYLACGFALALFAVSCGGNKDKAEDQMNDDQNTELTEESGEMLMVTEDGDNSDGTTSGSSSSDDASIDAISTDDVSSSSATSSADVDEALNKYEKLVNQLTTLATKVAKGDLSAVSEYTSLLSELSDLEALRSQDLTPAQAKRLSTLISKMGAASAKAASKVSGAAAGAAAAMSSGAADAIEALDNLDFDF